MLPVVLLLVDSVDRLGGTETHIWELATRLPAAGYRPVICSLAGNQPVLRQWAEAGVEIWPYLIHRLYLPPGRKLARAVTARAVAANVQVVHTFHFKSDWLGVRIVRAQGCPLISSRRDMGFEQTWLRRLAYQGINRQVDAYVAPSQAVKESVVRRESVEPERIKVIYNGLELGRFAEAVDRRAARAWLGVPEDGPLIGMVGNLRPIKDHPSLLQAMARIAPSHPDAHLVLLGEGVEEGRLRSMAAELGIADRVTFAGQRKEIPRALGAMDIFVLSSHSEGMSNAILEAMAAGLPVVATAVGGNAESVVDGITGHIVPRADVAAMADRLEALLAKPELAAAMGAAGRARVADLFDVNAMVRRTAELYASLSVSSAKETAHASA